MSIDFSLNAKARNDQGKGASRRLRRNAGLVPAIVYGAQKDPVSISLEHKQLAKALENEAFYTHIISLDIEGNKEDVLLKDLQRHPSKALILHADFLRVDKTKKVTIRIPLHFINEDTCVGVKAGGGVISHSMTDLEVKCLPTDIPEYLEVDMAEVQVGEILHISDIKLPENVESTQLSHGADHDLAVAMVNTPKVSAADEETTEAPAEEAAEEAPAEQAEEKKE